MSLPARYEAIVIGASAGGLQALDEILPVLPAGYGPAVLVVQHLHPASDSYCVEFFKRKCSIPVKEAEEKEAVKPGFIYFAPPNYHLLVERDRTFSLSVDARVKFSRPSIDVLFETAARAYGQGLIGVILTGANDDGAAGLAMVKKRGGLTIVQDPRTADVALMPRSALEACCADYVLDPQGIARLLSDRSISSGLGGSFPGETLTSSTAE